MQRYFITRGAKTTAGGTGLKLSRHSMTLP